MKKVTKHKLKEAFARDFLHEHHFTYSALDIHPTLHH